MGWKPHGGKPPRKKNPQTPQKIIQKTPHFRTHFSPQPNSCQCFSFPTENVQGEVMKIITCTCVSCGVSVYFKKCKTIAKNKKTRKKANQSFATPPPRCPWFPPSRAQGVALPGGGAGRLALVVRGVLLAGWGRAVRPATPLRECAGSRQPVCGPGGHEDT